MEKPNENKKEQSASYKARNGLIGSLVFGAITALVACWIHAKFREFPIGQIITFILALMAFLLFMVAISCFFDLREAKRIERMEEDARNEEKELAEIDPAQKALKAEKLYRVNQKELMRYYDMNIAQTKFLSILGIIMIIAGIVIVAATCYVYITMKYDKALLLVGNISGIIVNFIGAIFIRMYTKNLEAAVKFHAKFVENNKLLLANSIANKIENSELRENTLSCISKQIVSGRQDISNP